MSVDVDTSAIEHLDFNANIPCDHGKYHESSKECNETAVTAWTINCCGFVYFRCEEHTQYNRNWLKRNADLTFNHSQCGASITVDDVTERPL